MRPPTESELPLLRRLFEIAGLHQDPCSLRVEPMNDGGMGSLLFENVGEHDRRYGTQAAECRFVDADGIEVSVTLNLDQHGLPFEVDSWRVDFGKLQRWPSKHEIRDVGAT